MDHSISDVDIILLRFNTKPFKLDRNCHGGGIILYYKENINISMRPDLQIDGTEVMWIEIKVSIILLNIIYLSPTESGSLF